MAGVKQPGSPIPQYDLNEVSQKVLLEKAQRRAALREEFIKLKFDPFRHASEEGGVVVSISVTCYVIIMWVVYGVKYSLFLSG